MKMPELERVHPHFRLNGQPYSLEELQEVGYSLVKEGEAYEREIGDFLIDWCTDHPDVGVQTSGSTGSPVVHRLSKESMIRSAEATARFFGLQPGHKALLCLPVKYIGGKMMLVRAMTLGLSLDYVMPSATPLENSGATYDFCAMVPLQFLSSLESLDSVRQLIIGGAPLGEQGIAAARTLSTQVFETFGMTETISHIALRRINPPEPFFHTLEGVTVSADERGCLVIHAPQLTGQPVHTNDLVRVVSETSFEWLGRYDRIINSGGVKLVPEQIERKLQGLIHTPFFIAGLPDEKLGQRLVLVVEARTDGEILLEQLRSSGALTTYEVPKQVLNAAAFSKTGSGKVDRLATLINMGLV